MLMTPGTLPTGTPSTCTVSVAASTTSTSGARSSNALSSLRHSRTGEQRRIHGSSRYKKRSQKHGRSTGSRYVIYLLIIAFFHLLLHFLAEQGHTEDFTSYAHSHAVALYAPPRAHVCYMIGPLVLAYGMFILRAMGLYFLFCLICASAPETWVGDGDVGARGVSTVACS